tara:strand:- start:64 stop:816 length:753 start_codon:yes stop_codon:yes gene_type:complete
MFESKTITRNEQTLVIDDAEMIGIMPTGGEDSSYVVNFKMDRDGVETHLHVHLHRSHIEAIKSAQVLTVPQLRAVHAKAAQAEEVSKESPKPQTEVVEIPKNTPLTIEGKITVLEPGPAEDINWKDPKLKSPPKRQQDSRRLSFKEVDELMHQVFRWYPRWRQNNRKEKGRNPNYLSLERFLHVTLPTQFGITTEVAKSIYLADRYRSVTGEFRNQWGILIRNLKKNNMEHQMPMYLRKKYDSHNQSYKG